MERRYQLGVALIERYMAFVVLPQNVNMHKRFLTVNMIIIKIMIATT